MAVTTSSGSFNVPFFIALLIELGASVSSTNLINGVSVIAGQTNKTRIAVSSNSLANISPNIFTAAFEAL